jgi:hypothetical protein
MLYVDARSCQGLFKDVKGVKGVLSCVFRDSPHTSIDKGVTEGSLGGYRRLLEVARASTHMSHAHKHLSKLAEEAARYALDVEKQFDALKKDYSDLQYSKDILFEDFTVLEHDYASLEQDYNDLKVANREKDLQAAADADTIKRLRAAFEQNDKMIRKKQYYISQLEGRADYLEDENLDTLCDLMNTIGNSQKVIGAIINKKIVASKVQEKVVVDACPVCKQHIAANYILECGHGYCMNCINAVAAMGEYRCGVCRKVCNTYVKALNIREEMLVD